MDVREHIVYCLKCPDTKEVRYVGITRKPLWHRLSRHLTDARLGKKSNKSKWIRSLLEVNKKPIIEELCKSLNPYDKEAEYIKEFADKGAALLNMSKGGRGPNGVKRTRDESLKTAMKQGTPVIKYTLDDIPVEEYWSIHEAARQNNTSQSNISNCISGKQKTSCGFKWKLKEIIQAKN